MGFHTQHWFLLLLTLTLCSSQGLVTGDSSLGDTIELLQLGEIETLNRIIAEKDAEIKKKEDENQNLKKKISENQDERKSAIQQQLAEKETIKKELEGRKVLVNYMMNVLQHSEEMMRESEKTITEQAELVEKAHTENEDCKQENDDNTKYIFKSQETIRLQNDSIEKIKNIIYSAEKLNASYHDMSTRDDCNLPAFVSGMSTVLTDQEKEIHDLKSFLESDKDVKDNLESIKAELTKVRVTAIQSDEQWKMLRSYQGIISKQSKTIGQLRDIASYGVNLKATAQYEEDEAGNLVQASSCQCLPEIQNPTQLSVVLGSQDHKAVSLWSQWHYQDCFEWVKADNTTSDCGLHGKKVRHRVKDLDSDTWEEETEEEACGECKVPGIQGGSWTEWDTKCEAGSNRRFKLQMSGHRLKTEEETRECLPQHPQCSEAYTTLSDDWRKISFSSEERYYGNCDQSRGFPNGWYRFIFNGTNAWIPTEVAPLEYREDGKNCETFTAAWMDGTLPTLGEPPQNVTMRFTWGDNGDGDRDTIDADVVACQNDEDNPFYLYNLSEPSECDLAWCATTS